MANNTYIKTPPAFIPSDTLSLELHYDDSLIYTVAVLEIDGYDITYNTETHYTGLTKTRLLTGSGNDFIFNLPSNALLPDCPNDWSDYGLWGITADTFPVARVKFYTVPYSITSNFTYDSDGYVTNFDSTATGVTQKDLTSDTTLNLVLATNTTFTIPTIATQTATTVQVAMQYINHDCLGMANGDSSYAYIFDIYETNTNKLVYQSPKFYDWADADNTKYVTIENLEDGKTYYVQADLGMLCGYCLTYKSNDFLVDVSGAINPSDRVVLINRDTVGCVNVTFDASDLTYIKGVIERSLWGANSWLEIAEFGTLLTDNRVIIQDFYCIPNKKYVYRISLYDSNETLINIYENFITHTLSGICICDSSTSYITEIEYKYNLTKNERVFAQEIKDAKHPTVYNNTIADYCSGSVSGVYVIRNCDTCETYNFIDENTNALYREEILDWLNNGQAKFLKIENGLAFIVCVTGKPSMEEGDTDTTMVINYEWTEIANKRKLSNFKNLGLLIIS